MEHSRAGDRRVQPLRPAVSIISLGHDFNSKIIAEGVETDEPLSLIRLSGAGLPHQPAGADRGIQCAVLRACFSELNLVFRTIQARLGTSAHAQVHCRGIWKMLQ